MKWQRFGFWQSAWTRSVVITLRVMNHLTRSVRATLAAMLLLAASAAWGVTIDWVPIGNPGNVNDSTGYGSVASSFHISKYEVTNAQYAEFLNAKATSDPLGLYNTQMNTDAVGGITRSGSDGSYTYSVKSGQGNQPVVFVSWYDSIRFANWLNNGQGANDTETGAYMLLGGTATPSDGLNITRNPGAKVFLPSENEWYKAAFYNGSANTYVDYPTGTNTEPNSDQPPGDTAIQSNVGNLLRDDGDSGNGYNDGYAVTGSTSYNVSQNYLTDVGAYTGSPSLYGTFDQGGSVWEWNDTRNGSWRGVRGAAWASPSSASAAGYSHYDYPTIEPADVGFRLAAVPEPTSSVIAAWAAITFWWLRRRGREAVGVRRELKMQT